MRPRLSGEEREAALQRVADACVEIVSAREPHFRRVWERQVDSSRAKDPLRATPQLQLCDGECRKIIGATLRMLLDFRKTQRLRDADIDMVLLLGALCCDTYDARRIDPVLDPALRSDDHIFTHRMGALLLLESNLVFKGGAPHRSETIDVAVEDIIALFEEGVHRWEHRESLAGFSLVVDEVRAVCVVNGRTYGLSPSQHRIIVKLAAAEGAWVPGADLCELGDKRERPDRIIAAMPLEVGELIQRKSSMLAGYRLRCRCGIARSNSE